MQFAVGDKVFTNAAEGPFLITKVAPNGAWLAAPGWKGPYDHDEIFSTRTEAIRDMMTNCLSYDYHDNYLVMFMSWILDEFHIIPLRLSRKGRID